MDTTELEKLLAGEKKKLEETLSSLGTKNPQNPADWEPTFPDLGVTPADKSDLADEVEEFDNTIGVEAILEEKLREVEASLARIRSGKYGICEVGGEAMDEARLQANPEARPCIKHSTEGA